MERAMEIVQKRGTEQLERMLDTRSANPISIGSMAQLMASIERVMDPELSLPAFYNADKKRDIDVGTPA